MFVVLIYRPEAADGSNGKFDGIEVGFVTSNESFAEQFIDRMLDEHPDWQFETDQV